MTFATTIRLACMCLIGFGLAACGNTGDRPATIQVLRNLPLALGTARTEPSTISPQQIAESLSLTDRSALLFNVEEREAQALLAQIEQNGPYRSYGSRDRRVIVLRDGMLTGTRGFGGDLMSSDVDAFLALVSARQAGSAPYTQRYLTSDNQTSEIQYSCTVAPGDSIEVKLGALDETGQIVTARCSGSDGTHDMAFVVGRDGQILTARQWMGEFTGFVGVQLLRR